MEFLESPPAFKENTHLDAQLETSYRNLDRVIGSVTMADNKALIALTFQGAIVAGLALIAGFLKDVLAGSHLQARSVFLIFVLFAFFVFFVLATLRLFQTIAPRLHRTAHHDAHPSWLFYFGGIADMDPTEFADKMRALTPESIHEGIVTITHTNARIAVAKFNNLRHAYIFLAAQSVLFMIIVLFSVLPK